MRKLLVILGPTATGKTDLALSLAKKFNGELAAADSRQVYKRLDIGTGKLPSRKSRQRRDSPQAVKVKREKGYWEIEGIKIWMYDIVGLDKQYTVADYVKDAGKVIGGIYQREKLPILVGGTGLYIKAIISGLNNLAIPINKKLRRELTYLSLAELQNQLGTLSLEKWEKLNGSDQKNPRRLIRAIELSLSPRRSSFDFAQGYPQGDTLSTNVLKIGLTAPREILYKKVDLRILSRLKQGMIKETQKLEANGISLKRMRQLGLEYGVLADFLEGKINKSELVLIMQNKIHQYVKRQLTWFKKEKNIYWFDITDQDYLDKVEKLVMSWYSK